MNGVRLGTVTITMMENLGKGRENVHEPGYGLENLLYNFHMADAQVQLVDKLSQAILSAQDIGKCPICLENIHKAVRLWPCTHWFCRACISKLQKMACKSTVLCPLCNSVTPQREIFDFDDKQKEYEGYLQTLIGKLSLDLGSDVAYYTSKQEQHETVEERNNTKNTKGAYSPVRKIRKSASITVNESKNKNKSGASANKRVIKNCENLDISRTQDQTQSILSVPMTPLDIDPRTKKVKEWLDSTRFSEAETLCLKETVVVDIHDVECESQACSEQLQSVTQLESNRTHSPFKHKFQSTPCESLSDIDAIKPASPVKPLTKRGKNHRRTSTPLVEDFDQLLPKEDKRQIIATTYRSKNPYSIKSENTRSFIVEGDLFKSFEEPTEQDEEHFNSSLDKLEDFSSGSGEEWSMNKKEHNVLPGLLNKRRRYHKKLKKNKGSVETNCLLKPHNDSLKSSGDQTIKKFLQLNKTPISSSKCDEKTKSNKFAKHLINENTTLDRNSMKSPEDLISQIANDWNDIDDSDNALPAEKPLLENEQTCLQTNALVTPRKINQRSPGWSRLKRTKKEFHMSDKKKLSLKMLSKSKSQINIPPATLSLNNQNPSLDSNIEKTLDESVKKTACTKFAFRTAVKAHETDILNTYDKETCSVRVDELHRHFEEINRETHFVDEKQNTNLEVGRDKSFESSHSPFKGFKTPDMIKGPVLDTDLMDLNRSVEEGIQKDSVHREISVNQENRHSSPDKIENNLEEIVMEADMNTSKTQTHNTKETEGPSNNLLNKKRNRDSFNDESSLCLPPLKKMCQDAQVQTSPEDTESFLKDMIKTIWGIEVLTIIENKIKNLNIPNQNQSNIHSNIHNLVNLSSQTDKSPNDIIKTIQHIHNPTLSQSSDKENITEKALYTNLSMNKKCYESSDFIMGTEDLQNTPIAVSYKERNLANLSPISVSNILREQKVYKGTVDVDPDAPTQPYKTPVVLKQNAKSSTEITYFPVSNPTVSELKAVDHMLVKHDVIFSNDSPVVSTSLNCSGIELLDDSDTQSNNNRNITLQPSQSNTAKSIKSKRHLDFIETNSLSNDMFDITTKYNDIVNQKQSKQLYDNVSYRLMTTEDDDALAKTSNVIVKTKKFDENMEDNYDEIIASSVNGCTSPSDKQNKEMGSFVANQYTLRKTNNVGINACPKSTLKSSDDSTTKVRNPNKNMADTPGIACLSKVQKFENHIKSYSFSESSSKIDLLQVSHSKDINDSVGNMCPTNPLKSPYPTTPSRNMNSLSRSAIYNVKRNTNIITIKVGFSRDGSTLPLGLLIHLWLKQQQKNLTFCPSRSEDFIDGTPEKSQIAVQPQKASNSEEKRLRINSLKNETVQVTPDKNPFLSNKSGCALSHSVIEKSIDEEVTRRETKSYCFASSFLEPRQREILRILTTKIGCKYSTTIGPHVTHLVVNSTDGRSSNTFKFLYAMALHIPIINYAWVDSAIKENILPPVVPFIAYDQSGGDGVLRAAKDENRQLLQDFAIHVCNTNEAIIVKQQLEEIIRLCGGRVVQTLPQFLAVPEDKIRVILMHETPSVYIPGEWQEVYSALELDINWIFKTIGEYRVVPLTRFLKHSVTVSYLQRGYPDTLIFGAATQEQRSTC